MLVTKCVKCENAASSTSLTVTPGDASTAQVSGGQDTGGQLSTLGDSSSGVRGVQRVHNVTRGYSQVRVASILQTDRQTDCAAMSTAAPPHSIVGKTLLENTYREV